MNSACIREASQTCFYGCFKPFPALPETHTYPPGSAAASRYDFVAATASSLNPDIQFTNHESLPSLHEAFSNFNQSYPQYCQTDQADQIRDQEYYHLSVSNHVCLDYLGHGLFSYSQQQRQIDQTAPVPSTSSPSTLPSLHSTDLAQPFFDISYKSVNLNPPMVYGGEVSEPESNIQKRIMAFMNISEDDYNMVFTANQFSAFKLLADYYPFSSCHDLVTVYDHKNEAVEVMIESSKKKGARVTLAEFSWPNLRIKASKLKGKIVNKRNKRERGLFVFPLQSRVTGARYSYSWMSMAQENGWHVLLDASALGPKDMQTLGLSFFKPDFLFCYLYKIFGENPSGFGCLFVKKSSASVLKDSNKATNTGIVSIIPSKKPSQHLKDSTIAGTETRQKPKFELHKEDLTKPGSLSSPLYLQRMSDDQTYETHETEKIPVKQKERSFSGISEPETPLGSSKSKITERSIIGVKEPECRGLDHADSLGLILISSRAKYLVNWLVNALMSLKHPNSENVRPLVRIYGPKINSDRGPAVAFNVFDWKGEKIDPALVQKLADRNNISISYGYLHQIWFSDKFEEEREKILETRTTAVKGAASNHKRDTGHSGISVVTAALGFLTNFEDVYRLWAFVSRFLDADFVEKETWRYETLNQKIVEV
ncbi:hypothetical protein CFOL_v3_22895 [Cephalotus follicularis]|uniref:Aminotran_5 domain-containing protein n=1 Tax=Cephalotus follicularis TaxID=3775 RepID=A0A1Q3CGQ5_CEPFO|nr:hypothetical protein CFOL_v3_22895 [Cephalotus follicularis]